MKIIRYLNSQNREETGILHPDGSRERAEGNVYEGLRGTGHPADVQKLLAPIQPTSIVGIGLNYRRHAEETNAKIPQYPIVFFKGMNSLQNPDDPIEIPTGLSSDQVDFECELVVIIGKKGKNIPKEKALDYVLGYTCGNDVSARDWQKQKGGSQWCRGKSFDTFCPIGPVLVTAEEIPRPNELKISTVVSGVTMQDWSTNDMIFDVPSLIAFLSGSSTLLPGTIILTGTPHGVGMAQTPPRWLVPGDTVTIEIEKIGQLINPVVAEGQ